MPAPKPHGALTIERLREVLHYDAETGIFTWLKATNPRDPGRVGKRAGKVQANGYVYIGIDRDDYTAAVLAWFYVHGEWPTRFLRYVDGNPSNVALANLRPALRSHATRAEYERHYRQHNPNKFRGVDLKKNFGITLAQYDALLQAQGGVCAICKQSERDTRNGKVKWLAVDHCHDTQVVRGLLCAACNTTLGKMGDDPARLRAAAAYLERALEADNVIHLIPRRAA